MYGNYYYHSGAWAAIAGVLIVLVLLALGLIVLFYVFQGIGLFTMGKRRGLQAPWLAWLIPSFVMGAIADDYDERTKGKSMGLRWILLGLTIGSIVLVNLAGSSLVRYLVDDYYYYGSSAYGASSGILIVIGALISIVSLVFNYIALFRVYQSANPASALMLLLLSIFFPVIVPFVLFAQRKKDDGMPQYGQQGPMGYGAGPVYGGRPPFPGGQYQGYAGGYQPGYGQPWQNQTPPYPGAAQPGAPAQQTASDQAPVQQPSSEQPVEQQKADNPEMHAPGNDGSAEQ